jgi:hypothetical protein
VAQGSVAQGLKKGLGKASVKGRVMALGGSEGSRGWLIIPGRGRWRQGSGKGQMAPGLREEVGGSRVEEKGR